MRFVWKRIKSMINAAMAHAINHRIPRENVIRALNRSLGRVTENTAVVLVEIDRFRVLEQNYNGADVAQTLNTLENRVQNCLGPDNTVRRLDGGRFAIVPPPTRTRSPDELALLVTELQSVTKQPIRVESGQTHISLSVGYATQDVVPDPCGAKLIDAAAVALLEASNSGSSSVLAYSPDMQHRINQRKGLIDEIAPAIASGAIHAFFQPQVDIKSNKIVGFEALARWQHAERGMISPAEFLPVLVQLGMMRELGFTMLRAALNALHDWDRAGFDVPTVSINMSEDELRNPHLVDVVCMELDRCNLTPERLVIEILETVVAAGNDDLVLRNIKALSALGCAIDLDDFGTGKASITSIRQFGVDRIKIDRSFVRHIDTDVEQQDMIQAMLTMTDRLHVSVIAEGVETLAELAYISNTACHLVQGYAVSRPMPCSEVTAWINNHIFQTSFATKQQYIQ